MAQLVRHPLTSIGYVRQDALVPAGQSGVVFYLRIPSDYVAFIDQVANSYYPDCYLVWEIDGERVIVRHQMGTMNAPKEFRPPIVVFHYVKWVAYNQSTEDHWFEVLNDGYVVEREVLGLC